MLTQDEIVPLLRAASPSWRGDSDSPIYVQLGSYGQFVVEEIAAGRSAQLSPAFAAMERMHMDGDHWTREAAAIGLLESMQNVASHRQIKLEQVAIHLGPASRDAWNKLKAFWAGRRTDS